MSEVDPTFGDTVRFPVRRIGDKPLVLRRAKIAQALAVPEEYRGPDLSQPLGDLSDSGDTNANVGESKPISRSVAELENSLRTLEAKLRDREQEIMEQESWVAERARELAENEALVAAREAYLQENLKSQTHSRRVASPEEQIAINRVRIELDRREASLRETRVALVEREKFLDESEVRLFEKVQSQQEKELELEQWEEELIARERRVREREAKHDPEVAAELQREAARRLEQRDE
ncbi:MAG TPA: hypothetical protein PLN52_22240 [Opitutaceae bacterium]|nr:hypothetical protein [Opitutaceae bacterium]